MQVGIRCTLRRSCISVTPGWLEHSLMSFYDCIRITWNVLYFRRHTNNISSIICPRQRNIEKWKSAWGKLKKLTQHWDR